MAIEPGVEASVEDVVRDGTTAAALGSGDVDVLGTPWLVVLIERAAVAALAGRLEEGQTTVGTAVELRHLAPTPPGAAVTARARLTAFDGRTLTFECEVADPAGQVATALHRRVVVDRERFLDTARGRGGESP